MSDTMWNRRQFVQVVAGGVCGALTANSASARTMRDDSASFSFGVIADAQYCDADPAGTRYYRASEQKLAECVKQLNDLDLAFVIHLGDFIDRDFQSFARLLPVFEQIKAPRYHALGNHDFAVDAAQLKDVPAALGMSDRHYAFQHAAWRFIVLDGNDLSLYGRPEGSPQHQEAQKVYAALLQKEAANAQSWNGAVGDVQLRWLDQQLVEAEKTEQRVIIFCHFPVFPENPHNLWNSEQVLTVLESHRNVVAYLNGHNHAGNYSQKQRVHYVTLPGMVETADSNAFAVVHVRSNGLELQGFGRTPNRVLPFAPA